MANRRPSKVGIFKREATDYENGDNENGEANKKIKARVR